MKKIYSGKSSPSEDLALLKSTFDAKNEHEEIARVIIERFRPQQLNILDVGCGSGKLLHSLATRLRPLGYSVIGTGLDLDGSNFRYDSKELRLVEGDFLKFSANVTFDVVLVVQSLYYLGPPMDVLKRLSTLCNPHNGLVVVVLWSKECMLYKIGSQFRSLNKQPTIFAEELLQEITALLPSRAVSARKIHCAVDLSKWLKYPRTGKAAMRIISRMVASKDSETSAADFLASMKAPKGLSPRVNTVLAFPRPHK